MSGVEHDAFASPLALLDQWRGLEDGPPLREMVVLGFTHDLPFLERFALSGARQLGARITVLADGAQDRHDVVDVRFAGHGYQYGVTATRGAFHPKLVVLLGDEHVWLAIGSGNPTMSGWGHNQELWCILRGTTQVGLRAQADLGTWLTQLPGSVPMPSWIAATLAEVGARVVPEQVDDRADVRLLHNLTGPIFDDLPKTTHELNLAAPFFDPSGTAVRALVDRSRPERVRVAVQPRRTSFDGRSLTAALSETPTEFRAVDDGRTMHGKLLEYVDRDGSIIAVVGSPNITSAALLRTVSDGGNCELAVAAPVASSLLPEAALELTADDIAATPVLVVEPGDDDLALLRLLGCRRTEDGLDLEFIARRRAEVTVETSLDGSPGSWSVRAVLPDHSITISGLTYASVAVPEGAGTRVRLVATFEGRQVMSSPAFVTDPHRCRARTDVGNAPALRRVYDLEDVITDEGLLRRFGHDLINLLELAARERAAAPAPLRTPTGVNITSSADAGDPWTRLLDLTAHALGASLLDVAFPGALPSPAGVMSSTSWSVQQVDDETELADGETEDVIDQPDAAPAPRHAPQVAPNARSHYRSWIRRWVRAISTTHAPPLPLRMTVTGLALELLAAGVYENEPEWREVLAQALTSLVEDSDEITASPPEMHGYLGSLVAVGMALLRQDTSLHGGRPEDVLVRRVWEATHSVAARAQEALVEELLLRSTQEHARHASSAEVHSVIALARDALTDPNAEVLAGFEDAGLDIQRHEGIWVVRGRFRNPTQPAARVVTDLDTPDGVVGVAVGVDRTAIMVRRGTALAMLDSTIGRWRVYECRRPSTPSSFLGREGVPPTKRIYPGVPIPEPVADLVAGLDIDLEEIVREYAPNAPRALRRR